MQQNAQYGMGYYTQPPVPSDYGAPCSSQLPSSYTSAPSYDPAQNPSNACYNLANHPYAIHPHSSLSDDRSFRSFNSPYLSSDTSSNLPNPIVNSSYAIPYEPSNSPNLGGPPASGAVHEQPYDYGSNFSPHPASSPAFRPQADGSNHELYRNNSYPEAYPQAGYVGTSPQVAGFADQGIRSSIPANLSEYNQSRPIYYEGAGYERSGFEQIGPYGQVNHDRGSQESYNYADVYPYNGGQVEPYGSRGTGSFQSSNIFNPLVSSGGDTKISKSSPKLDGEGSGAQKYRVKLLPESNMSDSPTDCICQIGLDGVRLVFPATNKTLRIYPLETIIKWEVSDSSTLTFWAKTVVDAEQRRIRLQSNSYTTSAMLDTLTAACVQLSEMIDNDKPAEASKGSTGASGSSEPGTAKKSSFADWVTLKPKPITQEEKQHWVPDEAVKKCTSCGSEFGAFNRRHHCRNCGDIFCDKCTRGRTPLTSDQDSQAVRVCDACLAEVTQRLLNADSSSRPTPQQSHEDFAKKLQEEMERTASRKASRDSADNRGGSQPAHTSRSESFSLSHPPHLWTNPPLPEVSGPRMREVACPTCTVHLQVQVPSFGTETVECGVCQHPFLVSA